MRKLGGILAAAILGIGGAAIATPAHADNTYPDLEICNSSNSRGPLGVTSAYFSGTSTVPVGACKWYKNTNDTVRVDPEVSGYPDVDSSWWGYEGQGLDYCDAGEGWINPPNYYLGYIKYNTDASGC